MQQVDSQPLSSSTEWLSGAHGHAADFFQNVTPLTPWMLAGGLLVAIILWMKGSSCVRPALTLTGAILGAAAGGALATPIASTVVGLAGGAVIGAIAGYLSFRIVSAGVAGVLAGILATGGSIIYLDRHDNAIPAETKAPLNTSEEAVFRDASDLWQRTLKGEVGAADAKAESQSLLASGAGSVLRDGVKARYEALPEQSKLFVSAAAAVGAMFGILVGLIFPRGIAAFSTASLGAAGMIAGGLLLAVTLRSPGAMQIAAEPARLLGPWAFLTIAGLWLQRSKPKAKQQAKAAAPQPVPCAPAPAPAA